MIHKRWAKGQLDLHATYIWLRTLLVIPITLLLFILPGCATKNHPPVAPATTVSEPQNEAQTQPQRSEAWSDAVLYFVIVDRFADGDPSNNQNVDINAKGTFHGGDLKGLIKNLNQISDLGVTAIWITPVVKNIDDFVTGAGFPDWGYHGYWADDFYKIDPAFWN